MRSSQQSIPSAFTLVEVLFVVAIIGVLAALLLAALDHAKSRAQRVQCINNLHQLGVGLQSYLADNHSYPSYYTRSKSDNPETWHCPSARWSDRIPAEVAPTYYSYNCFGALRVGSKTNYGLLGHYDPISHARRPIAELEVVAPTEMMALGDSFNAGVVFMRLELGVLEKYGNTRTRHQGKVNVLFCDGHVESPTLNFLFEDTSDEALSHWNRDHQPHRELLAQ